MVFCVNHVQPQGAQVPRLQDLTAVVSGLQEVPGHGPQNKGREAAAPPRGRSPVKGGSVSGSEAEGGSGAILQDAPGTWAFPRMPTIRADYRAADRSYDGEWEGWKERRGREGGEANAAAEGNSAVK